MTDQTSPSHRQTWDVIPWLVNGTATADEHALAEAHLRSCADCRDEYAFQARLQAGLVADAAGETNAYSSLQQLFARIDANAADDTTMSSYPLATDPRPPLHRESRQRPRRMDEPRRHQRVLTVALIAQSAAIVLLGALLLVRMPAPAVDAPYRTLSRPADPVTAATIRLVPSPTLTVGAMQTMLADAKLRIVESNQGGSIFGLAIEAQPADGERHRVAAVADAVSRLRSERGVLLAEPIGAAIDSIR